MNNRRTTLTAMAAALLVAAPLAAQDSTRVVSGVQSGGLYLSRADLQQLLSEHEQVASAPGQAPEVRDNALASAARIRARLREGDFQAGDRMILEVRNAPPEGRMGAGRVIFPLDTLDVRTGPSIAIEGMGDIPLDGVLRAELEPHLEREFANFVRDPVVEATALVRVSVQGSVGQPGFYTVPAYMPLGDILMTAGGTGQGADLEEIRIERVDETVMEGSDVRQALADGRSLDQLNLEAGDQIVVPEETDSPWAQIGRVALIVGSSVFLGVRIFF